MSQTEHCEAAAAVVASVVVVAVDVSDIVDAAVIQLL